MGIYSDFLNNVTTVDTSLPREGEDRVIVRQINALMDRQGDRDYPSGYAKADEVQEIATYDGTVSGGTFTLTFSLWSGETFTTDNIAYDADASTIETAIDTAAAAAGIKGFTAGDISVSGGNLGSAALVLTYDGDSVAGQNHDPVVIDGTNLTGGGSAGEVSVKTEGQSNRTAWAILVECGAITVTLPAQGDSPTDVAAATSRATNPLLPDAGTLRALARAAAVDDRNQDVEDAILDALGL